VIVVADRDPQIGHRGERHRVGEHVVQPVERLLEPR